MLKIIIECTKCKDENGNNIRMEMEYQRKPKIEKSNFSFLSTYDYLEGKYKCPKCKKEVEVYVRT